MADEENSTPDPQEARQQKYEQAAREKGWKPEEEFDGPEGGFVGAEEFLKREPLFDKIRTYGKEIKGLKRTIEAMTTQFDSQVKAQTALRIKELQSARKEAIKVGDVEAVEEFDAQIDEQKQATTKKSDVPTEVSDWIGENEWFETDPELNAWAIAHNQSYVAKNKNVSIAESLEKTAEAVKRAFPEKFGKAPKAEKKDPPPSPVEGSGVPKDTTGSKGYSVTRLSKDQKLVYNQMVKQHKILSHDDYFKGLEEIGELA